MTRLAILALIATPAAADLPPQAFPERYLVATICTAEACTDRSVAIYDAGPMACTMGAMAILPTIVMPGETVAEWRCE